MHIADALSCAYLNEHTEDLLGQELELCWIKTYLPVSEEKMSVFRKATATDQEMQLLHIMTMDGWPKERSEVPKQIHIRTSFQIGKAHCSKPIDKRNADKNTQITSWSGEM